MLSRVSRRTRSTSSESKWLARAAPNPRRLPSTAAQVRTGDFLDWGVDFKRKLSEHLKEDQLNLYKSKRQNAVYWNLFKSVT